MPTPDVPTNRKTPIGLRGSVSFGAAGADRLGDSFQGVGLADDALLHGLAQIEHGADFVGLHPPGGNAGPALDDFGDRLAVDDREDQRLFALQRPQLGPSAAASAVSVSRAAILVPPSGASERGRAPRRSRVTIARSSCPARLQAASSSFARQSLRIQFVARVAWSAPAAFRVRRYSSSVSIKPMPPLQILDRRGNRGLAHRHAGAGGVDQADRLVGQLAARDVAGRQAHRLDSTASSRMRTLWCVSSVATRPRIIAIANASLGSSTFTVWKRRVRAASFSKYFLYSAQVVAAIVRSSPRASAGFSRLAASPCPAARRRRSACALRR